MLENEMPKEVWINNLIKEKGMYSVTRFECTFDEQVSPSNDTKYIREDIVEEMIGDGIQRGADAAIQCQEQ